MIKNKVSIIVPVYNVEKYLEQCVNSILAQTYKNIEVILVDDGSPDNCPQICDDFAAKDQRIKVIHKKNGGLSSARNAGLDVATGEYVMFIDSDDFIDSKMVEFLLETRRKTHADIVCCGMCRYNGDMSFTISETTSKKNIEIYDTANALKKLVLTDIDCSSCNKLYTKELINETRFKVGRNNEDKPFLFELYQKCNTVAYTDKVYYYYRITEGSITNSFNEKSFDVLKNINDLKIEIENKGLNLRDEIRLKETHTHIYIARNIQKNKCKSRFNREYNLSREYIKRNIILILFNSYFSIKVKVLAVAIILKFV